MQASASVIPAGIAAECLDNPPSWPPETLHHAAGTSTLGASTTCYTCVRVRVSTQVDGRKCLVLVKGKSLFLLPVHNILIMK